MVSNRQIQNSSLQPYLRKTPRGGRMMARMMSTNVMAPMVPADAGGEEKARNHRSPEVNAANRCIRVVQADFASVTSALDSCVCALSSFSERLCFCSF
ncbi:hypothetical protein Mapa_013198 [Marchantia paleacea]|nr:hypothetical protein Mapa_013198 [Marchantia paleacea]